MQSKLSLAGKLQKWELEKVKASFFDCAITQTHFAHLARLSQIIYPSTSSLFPLISRLKALGFHTLAQSLPAVTPEAAYYTIR